MQAPEGPNKTYCPPGIITVVKPPRVPEFVNFITAAELLLEQVLHTKKNHTENSAFETQLHSTPLAAKR